jgi:hypothetical protein
MNKFSSPKYQYTNKDTLNINNKTIIFKDINQIIPNDLQIDRLLIEIPPT